MNEKRVSVAIPASVVSDTPHLREKTAKIGMIGRAAAIFKVGKVIIYRDSLGLDQAADMNLIATLLRYLETPQYLRKLLFKLEPNLHYAGILPPLRTPHHPLEHQLRRLKVGEFREGMTLSRMGKHMLVDIGVEQPALLLGNRLGINRRVTVKIVRIDKEVHVELANQDEIPFYWGYSVATEEWSLGRLLKSQPFGLTIATSRYGVPFGEVAGRMREQWRKASTILIVFGAPARGLYDIAKSEGFSLDNIVDFVVNTFPTQGTGTVRTEEAIIASLAIMNVYFRF